MMMRAVPFVLITVVLAACSSSKSDETGKQPAKAPEVKAPEKAKAPEAEKPPEPEPPKPPEPADGAGEIDMTVSGAVSATLKGKGGRCVVVKGAVEGASFQLSSDELGVTPSFTLTILVTSPEEWEAPAIVLNVGAPAPGSFAFNKMKPRKEDKVKLARDATSAEVDVQLRKVGGKETVQVKGSIRCENPVNK